VDGQPGQNATTACSSRPSSAAWLSTGRIHKRPANSGSYAPGAAIGGVAPQCHEDTMRCQTLTYEPDGTRKSSMRTWPQDLRTRSGPCDRGGANSAPARTPGTRGHTSLALASIDVRPHAVSIRPAGSKFSAGRHRVLAAYGPRRTELTQKPRDDKRPGSRLIPVTGYACARNDDCNPAVAQARACVCRSRPPTVRLARNLYLRTLPPMALLHTRSTRSFVDFGSGGGSALP